MTTDGDTKAAMRKVVVFVLAEGPPHFTAEDDTPRAEARRDIWKRRRDEAVEALDELAARLSEQEAELERLRGALKDWQGRHANMVKFATDERAELRKALEGLALHHIHHRRPNGNEWDDHCVREFMPVLSSRETTESPTEAPSESERRSLETTDSPTCPTCGSDDPKVTLYDITGRCTDPFHTNGEGS